ncbi:MAG: glycoside hydrolase family 26 protein, partial [Alistipes sp.]|nr:glycoside hydrolase family 26 protein [Alistipes sp.]
MNLFKTIALSICLGAGSTFCIDAATTTPLLDSLRNAVDSGRFYFGHHDDTAYGHEREYTDDASDVLALTGKLPGMMSWDLGDIEHGVDRNLDGVPFAFIASEVRRQHERGGLTTISWHPDNPVSGGDSWDVSTAPVSLMQSGPAVRDSIAACINRAADFIGDLRDAEGNRIPVIFRPWHENTGSWFWWGAAHCTPEQYIDLWRLTRRCFDEKGIDNVVWAYSPDKDLTAEKYLLTYPGDEYVDILACDIYHFNGEEGLDEYLRRADTQFAFISRMAQE